MKTEGEEITFLKQETRKQVMVSHWLDNYIGLLPEEKPKIQKNISYLIIFKITGGGEGYGGMLGAERQLYLLCSCGMINSALHKNLRM